MNSLMDAADFVPMVARCRDIKLSLPEETAYQNGGNSEEKLTESSEQYGRSPCRQLRKER